MVTNQAIFHPSCLILYKEFQKRQKQTNLKSLSNLTKGAKGDYNGWMSPATARKSKKMINNLLISMEHAKVKRTPTFVTLTLPAKQKHDDKFIKRQLFSERFMKTMIRKFDIKNYFWRAEPQENDNIHIHAIFDNAIPWQNVRGNWNYILGKYGYLDDYKKNQKAKHNPTFQYQDFTNNTSRKKQYQKYLRNVKSGKEKVFGPGVLSFSGWDCRQQFRAWQYGESTDWQNPNSTDIHAIGRLKNVSAYVTKYMTKTPDDITKYRKIDGRIWGCSDSIRDLKYYTEFVDKVNADGSIRDINPELYSYLSELENLGIEPKMVDDFVTIFMLDKNQKTTLKKHAPTIYTEYTKHYQNQANLIYS